MNKLSSIKIKKKKLQTETQKFYINIKFNMKDCFNRVIMISGV